MKYFIVFSVCCVLLLQNSCLSPAPKPIKKPEKKINAEEQALISVSSLLLKVPKQIVLNLGLVGSPADELSPAEANKLLSFLKQQPEVELAALNSCVFASGKSGTSRDVTERDLLPSKTGSEHIDVGRLFAVEGSYNPHQDTISLTINDESVIMPEKPGKETRFAERMAMGTHLTIKAGHTLLCAKLFFPDNTDIPGDNNKYLLFLVTAKLLNSNEKPEKISSGPKEKMIGINALVLKVSGDIAAKWGLDGTPPLNPKTLPLGKPIPEILSFEEKKILLAALLKQPEVQFMREQAISIKNGSEGSLRYVWETKEQTELGWLITISPQIDDKNQISFRFNPTAQTRNSISEMSAATIDMPVCLKNNHTFLLKNTLSSDNKNISLLFLTAKIIEDKDNTDLQSKSK